MTSKSYWEGQFCIVTGAASGIGLATAQLLSDSGATVLGLDRNERSDQMQKSFRKTRTSTESVIYQFRRILKKSLPSLRVQS